MTIFSYPDDVLFGLIREWLCIHSIVNVDSSVCNKFHRCDFLDLLKRDSLALVHGNCDCCIKKAHHDNDTLFVEMTPVTTLKWICLKGIKLSELCLSKTHFNHVELLNRLDLSLTTYLRFSPQKSLPQEVSKSIIKSCPKLQSLVFRSIDSLSDTLISKLSIVNTLTELVIITKSPKLTLKSFEYIANNCANLKELTIVNKHTTDDKSLYTPDLLVELLKKNNNLTILYMDLHRHITDEKEQSLLQIISQYCNKMKECYISTFEAVHVSHITLFILNYTELNVLNVTTIQSVNQPSHLYAYFRYYCADGHKTIKLTEYHLNQTQQVLELFDKVRGFTEISIESLFKQTRCVDDEMFTQINKHNIDTLKKLSISGTAITNDSFAMILKSCSQLTELDLYHTVHIKNDDIENLITHLGSLRALSLQSMEIKLATLKSLILYCTELTELRISFCNGLQAAELELFCVAHKPELKLEFESE
jgi:hypothetical protein